MNALSCHVIKCVPSILFSANFFFFLILILILIYASRNLFLLSHEIFGVL